MVKHIVDARQFKNIEFLEGFFSKTDEMKSIIQSGHTIQDHAGRIVCSLFYQPSTRTKLSFDSAAKRLGADVIGTENAEEFSSAYKGETLEHSILATQENYDIVILRHPENGAALRAAKVSNKTIINAGDGNNQHPTQALLDVYTIEKKLGRKDNLKWGFLGDLRNGRTVRSNAYLLANFEGNEFYFVSPESLRMRDDILSHFDEKGVKYYETDNIMDFIREVDGLYVTRVQQEQLEGSDYEDVIKNYEKFVIDAKKADMMKEGAIIMHPLPINTEKSDGRPEITPEVDYHPKAVYFEQSGNGLYTRMALLDTLFRNDSLCNLIHDLDPTWLY